MTTPTIDILCPDCGRDAWLHLVSGVGGGVDEYGDCHNSQRICVERFVIEDRAETRRAALLEAAGLVCDECNGGDVPNRRYSWGVSLYHAVDGEQVYCDASDIRNAIFAQEQERAQGEGGGQ